MPADAIMLPYRAAGIKAAMDLMGVRAGRSRRPTRPMPDDEVARLEAAMRDAGLPVMDDQGRFYVGHERGV